MMTGVHESPRLYSAIVTLMTIILIFMVMMMIILIFMVMMMILLTFMVMLNKYDDRNTSERSSFASVVF